MPQHLQFLYVQSVFKRCSNIVKQVLKVIWEERVTKVPLVLMIVRFRSNLARQAIVTLSHSLFIDYALSRPSCSPEFWSSECSFQYLGFSGFFTYDILAEFTNSCGNTGPINVMAEWRQPAATCCCGRHVPYFNCYIREHFDLEPDYIIRKLIWHRIQRCREIMSTFHTRVDHWSVWREALAPSRYHGNPQILDGRLEVQLGWVRTLWDAPVDVERPQNP